MFPVRPLADTMIVALFVCLPAGLAVGAGCSDGGGETHDDPGKTGSDDARTGWLADVEAPLPVWLSETGIYADGTGTVPGPGAVVYVPTHPLWSNGADKERLLFMPPDARITPEDDPAAPWAFPVGTVLVKSFSLDDVDGRTGAVKIETRILARRSAGWLYALYHWNADGTEAALARADWRATPLRLMDAAGTTFEYTLPGRLECRGCHEAPGPTPVLGIARWQVPAELTDVFSRPPAPADVGAFARTPAETEALGYFVGNCAYCHNGRDTSENAAFSLEPPDAVGNTVEQETDSSASGVGVRVVPGDPEGSAVFEAVVLARAADYPGDLKPMPPLGIDRVDPRAAQALRRWILELGETDAP
jgi:mono/diheme cytochrome c family protein